MIISDICIDEIGEQLEVSAWMGDFRLWYRLPADCSYVLSADPFVAAAFFPAAKTGENIVVDSSVDSSPKLSAGMSTLQEIFCTWRKDLSSFSVESRATLPKSRSVRVGAFFSGGVDSVYTLSLHQSEITDLFFINGFDFEMSPEEFSNSLRRVRRIAGIYGKTVTPIETNFYSFNKLKGTGRIWSHGSCLASVALLLGCSRCYIPNSYPYTDLRPWGTHALTDHLWSNEITDIIHDSGACGRAEKIQAIARHPEALEDMVVCWNEPDRNCGRCGKCLRTMVTLSLLNIRTESFPNLLSFREVARLDPPEHEEVYTRDNIELAKNLGADAMQRALEASLKRASRKALIKDIDNFVAQGAVLRLLRSLRTRAFGGL